MACLVCLLLLLDLARNGLVDAEEVVNLHIDKTGWLNPHEPQQTRNEVTNNDAECESALLAYQSDLERCRLQLEACDNNDRSPARAQPSMEQVIMKHVIRNWMEKLNELQASPHSAAHHFAADLQLGHSDAQHLRAFLRSSPPANDTANALLDVRAAMERLLVRAERVDGEAEGQSGQWWDVCLAGLQVANMFVLVPAFAILLRQLSILTYRQFLFWLCQALFWISVVWTWFHMYKEKQVEHRVHQLRAVPSHCLPAEQQSLASVLRQWFTFRSASAECLEYQRTLFIDPFWEVPPTEALATTIVKFLLTPARHVGHHLGQFFTAFYSTMPSFLASLLITPLLFLLALVVCGYSFRLPFFLGSFERRSAAVTSCQQCETYRSQVAFLERNHDLMLQQVTMSIRPRSHSLASSASFDTTLQRRTARVDAAGDT